MNGYEKIISRMRSEGMAYNPSGMELGTMLSDGSVSIGELKLDTEDYKKLGSVGTLKKDDTVLVYPLSEELYIIVGKVV